MTKRRVMSQIEYETGITMAEFEASQAEQRAKVRARYGLTAAHEDERLSDHSQDNEVEGAG